MKILLTGATGFIGHHFVEAILKTTDWEIVMLDGLTYAGNPTRLREISCWEEQKHRTKFVWWDLKSPLTFSTEKEIGEVDYVLHLAAESSVDKSIQNPYGAVIGNVIGTVNLLDWVRLHPVKKFIYFSTDEVYGPIDEGTWDESARHAPGNPYSASKAAAEDICLAYANTYKLPIVITNTMNVIGERQHPEKYVPMVIKKVLDGEKVTIHATPDLLKAGSRFYIHARNAFEAIKFILLETEETIKVKDPSLGRFNIVGDEELDNLTLAQKIAGIVGKDLVYEMVDFHSSRPGHDTRYGLNGDKLKNLGFTYPKSFDETLNKVVGWYLNHKEWL
jgi:dTDP-glucose 4,6-dehydratase